MDARGNHRYLVNPVFAFIALALIPHPKARRQIRRVRCTARVMVLSQLTLLALLISETFTLT